MMNRQASYRYTVGAYQKGSLTICVILCTLVSAFSEPAPIMESGRFSGVKPLSWLALEGGNTDTSGGRCSPTPRRSRGFLSAGGDVLHASSIPSVVSSPFACSRLD